MVDVERAAVYLSIALEICTRESPRVLIFANWSQIFYQSKHISVRTNFQWSLICGRSFVELICLTGGSLQADLLKDLTVPLDADIVRPNKSKFDKVKRSDGIKIRSSSCVKCQERIPDGLDENWMD